MRGITEVVCTCAPGVIYARGACFAQPALTSVYCSSATLLVCNCRAVSASEPDRDGYTVNAFAICSTVRLLSTAIEIG